MWLQRWRKVWLRLAAAHGIHMASTCASLIGAARKRLRCRVWSLPYFKIGRDLAGGQPSWSRSSFPQALVIYLGKIDRKEGTPLDLKPRNIFSGVAPSSRAELSRPLGTPQELLCNHRPRVSNSTTWCDTRIYSGTSRLSQHGKATLVATIFPTAGDLEMTASIFVSLGRVLILGFPSIRIDMESPLESL